MVGLGALVGLAGVDDECRREYHLGQSEGGSKQEAMQQDGAKAQIWGMYAAGIPECGNVESQRHNSPQKTPMEQPVCQGERC